MTSSSSLQQVAVGVEQLFVGRPPRSRSVLSSSLKIATPAALAVDDAQVADDAGEQLRLAACRSGRRCARLQKRRTSAATLVEQVAREVEAERRLLERQPLLHAPRRRPRPAPAPACSRRAHRRPNVEQAALVGVAPPASSAQSKARPTLASSDARSGCSASKAPALISASTTRLLMRLRSTRAQKSNRLVNGAALRRARRDDRLDRALAGALDRAQAVADRPCRVDRLEAVSPRVDVRRLERRCRSVLRVVEQHLAACRCRPSRPTCWPRRTRPCSAPSARPSGTRAARTRRRATC